MVACQVDVFRPDEKSGKSDPTDHRRREVFHRRRAELLRGVAGLGAQDRKHALDAGLAEGAKSPQTGPSDAHRLCADRQRLDDVAAAAEAAVDQYRNPAGDGFDDFRQHLDGRADAVLDPPAMVGDDDRVDAAIGGEFGVLEGERP
jgi:hypothetical protein